MVVGLACMLLYQRSENETITDRVRSPGMRIQKEFFFFVGYGTIKTENSALQKNEGGILCQLHIVQKMKNII